MSNVADLTDTFENLMSRVTPTLPSAFFNALVLVLAPFIPNEPSRLIMAFCGTTPLRLMDLRLTFLLMVKSLLPFSIWDSLSVPFRLLPLLSVIVKRVPRLRVTSGVTPPSLMNSCPVSLSDTVIWAPSFRTMSLMLEIALSGLSKLIVTSDSCFAMLFSWSGRFIGALGTSFKLGGMEGRSNVAFADIFTSARLLLRSICFTLDAYSHKPSLISSFFEISGTLILVSKFPPADTSYEISIPSIETLSALKSPILNVML